MAQSIEEWTPLPESYFDYPPPGAPRPSRHAPLAALAESALSGLRGRPQLSARARAAAAAGLPAPARPAVDSKRLWRGIDVPKLANIPAGSLWGTQISEDMRAVDSSSSDYSSSGDEEQRAARDEAREGAKGLGADEEGAATIKRRP
jgi:hypothetical protein